MLTTLWNDETGLIISAELIILLTIGVIALVVGLSSLRDSVVTELADVGQAIGNANQSYSLVGIRSPSAFVAGSAFFDQTDFCDSGTGVVQNSRCVVVCNGVVMGSENTQ